MGTVFISGNRRYVYDKRSKKNYIYADLLWNKCNPGDKLKSGEVVHHRDGDSLNDVIENYEKMSRSAHMRYYSIGVRNPFYGRKHSEVSKNIMSSRAIGRIPPSRKDSWHLCWDINEALVLRKGGMSWVELGKKYEVTPEAVAQAFKRRKLT